MKEKFDIENAGPADVNDLAAFVNQEYTQGEIADANFLRWQYFKNPSGPAVISLARDEQHSIASQYALIPLQVLLNGKVVMGSLSLNTLTHARYRGKGLFIKTAEATYRQCAERGILFTIGVPNKNSYGGFISRLRFSNAGNLRLYIKPLAASSVLRSIFRRGSEKKGAELRVVLDTGELARKSISNFHPVADRELYEVFIEKWHQQIKIAVNRSAEYLEWRYFSNPSRSYSVYKLTEGAEMKAFLVLRCMNIFGMKAGVIMDFLSTSNGAGTILLNGVCSGLKRNRIEIVAATSAGRDDSDVLLRKSGFISVPKMLLPQQLPLIVKAHQHFENAGMLFDLKNWHFSFGDYDIF